MEEFSPGLVPALIGMRTEIVPLRLKQICRQPCMPVTVIICQGRTDSRCRNTQFNCSLRYPPPRGMCLLHCLLEEWIQKEIDKTWIFIERFLDISQERGPYDATTPPHECYTA